MLVKNKERIEATTEAVKAVNSADVIFIAVGTPFDGKHIDLTYIKQASEEIGKAIKDAGDFKVVVVKSTVIPNTTMEVVRPLVLKYAQKNDNEVGFAMNPEFLREGNAVEDFLDPDRIVLGVSSRKVEKILTDVYNGYSDSDILITNPTTAEMIKYTANSFLALTISYANEVARICEHLPGVDSEEVFKGVILDKRFSPKIDRKRIIPQLSTYLRAGIGFGGSCFPKDVKALDAFSKDLKVDGRLLDGLLHINETQLQHVFQMGMDRHSGKVERIAILGTAFKPDTDDIRESPGIKLAEMALDHGIKVAVQDYIALDNTRKAFGKRVEYFEQPLDAVKEADVVFVVTIWDQYKKIDDDTFEANMKEDAVMIDTRSLFKDREARPWRYRVGLG